MEKNLYNTLAVLLSYPESDYCETLYAIGSGQPAIGKELSAFADQTASLSLHDLQELFIQTFDLSPVCSLEMGWHLFGENYDRGLLLVKMRQQLRAHEVAEGTELPDHLTNAFRLIPCMERDHAAYFVEAIVFPALEKMIEAFSPRAERGANRVQQGFPPAGPQQKETARPKSGNPYIHVLLAARQLLQTDFPEVQFAAAAAAGGLRVLA